ncbi:MAG: 4-hydroxy-tetrahydrodipicolinate synthase [Clostridia bacterium]|nr:4-hydroxy-tetrahydrodipicolinate synthase [Clostridia bacterium]
MKKTIFTGAGVALVTPFNDDDTINFDKLGELIEFQIQNKTDAIIVCGTTGESAALNHEEHSEVIKYAVKKIAGRVPVIAGTGSNDTRYCLKLCKEAENAGVDAFLMVTPYYNKTSQDGLFEHYKYISDNTNTPMIIYNVPSRTGLDIKPETYYRLSKLENVVAIKEANGDISALSKTIALCKDNLDYYSGNDDQIVPFLSLGAKGVISVMSNILPSQTHKIVEDYLNGDVKSARDAQIYYTKLINTLFSDVNPIVVKSILNYAGVDVGHLRRPLISPNEDQKKQILDVMKEYNLTEIK